MVIYVAERTRILTAGHKISYRLYSTIGWDLKNFSEKNGEALGYEPNQWDGDFGEASQLITRPISDKWQSFLSFNPFSEVMIIIKGVIQSKFKYCTV
jgi:hypothetical protein